MARKKTSSTGPELLEGPIDFSKPSKAAEIVRGLFGSDVVTNGREIFDTDREVFSTGSPALDSALGGGVLTGTSMTIAGQPGCGKTSTAMSMAAVWQSMGRRVAYLSAEGRFYRANMQVEGLDPSRIEVYQHAKGAILSAEKFLEIAETILETHTHTMVIIDSLSILATNAERDRKGYDKAAPVASAVRLVSDFCKRVTPIVPVNDNVVVGIAHVYTNIGGHGKKYATSMAKKAEYFRSTAIECSWTQYLQRDGDKSAWGQRIHWNVERSPLIGPKAKAESILRYGHGIDREMEYIEMAADLGLVSSKGAYYYLDYLGEDVKGIQGMDKACQFLRENPEAYDQLRDRIGLNDAEPDAT